jgi:hypothetical protein
VPRFGLRALGIAVLAAFLGSCGPGTEDGEPPGLPEGSVLIERDEYQVLYGPEGQVQRLLRDADGDGVAEVVVVFGSDGKPERGEIDTDGDGVVDRWEYLDSAGGLEAVGLSQFSIDTAGDPGPE